MEKFNRVLLKLSGEALAGEKHTGFDEATCIQVAEQVKKVVDAGVEVAIVIGGGNYWRGRSSETIDRPKADQIGMLATVMNCIYVSEIFRYVGMQTSIYTPFACGTMSELFSKDKAVADLKNGKVVFLAGGAGNQSALGVVVHHGCGESVGLVKANDLPVHIAEHLIHIQINVWNLFRLYIRQLV